MKLCMTLLALMPLVNAMEEKRVSQFVDMPAVEQITPIPRRAAQSPLIIGRPPSQEIHIHIEEHKEQPNTPANSTEDSEDTIPKHRHNRRMIVSNSLSALIATLITAGVTLTVHFTNCKK